MPRLPAALALALLAALATRAAAGDPDDLAAAREAARRETAGVLRQFQACVAAPVPRDEEFIAATVFTGETLGNVVIAPDLLTRIVRVDVAPGARPLTLFLAGNALIWDFEGDVARVRRVVVIPAQAAVRGLPADRVDFSLDGCSGFYMQRRSGSHEDQSLSAYELSASFGRLPDRDVYQHSADVLHVPSAMFSSQRASGPRTIKIGSDPTLDFTDYYPAGFRELDQHTLVSPSELTVPATFPEKAGLVELLRTGAIWRARPDEVIAWIEGASAPFRSKLSPDFALSMSFRYVITREIELPVHGGDSFLLPAGVSKPHGLANSGACVGYMDGFRISSEDCLGQRGELRDWRKLESVPDNARCHLLAVAPNASMQAVSISRPEVSANETGDPAPVPVDVRVERAGEVFLVLNTARATLWRISAGPQTMVTGVLLTGHARSAVEGLPADTPVVAVDRESNRSRPKPDPACAPFFAYTSSAFQGGPAAAALDRQVQGLTGRSLDGLQAAYHLRSVTIR
ncbi:MAG: hypothetical protein JO328_12850 [Hyphomicrobiales bacterium]|nr:hypothetical protein [Hyphomicrobiales bacterium]MBV8826421.1 hypothetical protein [Hyphomicrobiales bacterium]